VLYKANHFQLVDITEQQVHLLRSFLDCIGSLNANSLSHLCVNFPVAETIPGQPGDVKLRDDSFQILKLVQERCTNLSTLETLVHHKNSGVFKKAEDSFQEALSPIDAHSLKPFLRLKRSSFDFSPMTECHPLQRKTLCKGLDG
jgi:hypothetical protein